MLVHREGRAHVGADVGAVGDGVGCVVGPDVGAGVGAPEVHPAAVQTARGSAGSDSETNINILSCASDKD